MSNRPSRGRIVVFAAASLATLLVTPPLAAQHATVDTTFLRAAAAPAPLPTPPETASTPPVGAGILGGTLGSAAGMVGGGLVGYGLRTCSSGEWLCGLGEAAVGALVGSVVGSTLGANLGARSGGAKPTFGSTMMGGLVGVLAGLAGGYVGAQLGPEGHAPLIGFAVGQGVVTGLVAASQR